MFLCHQNNKGGEYELLIHNVSSVQLGVVKWKQKSLLIDRASYKHLLPTKQTSGCFLLQNHLELSRKTHQCFIEWHQEELQQYETWFLYTYIYCSDKTTINRVLLLFDQSFCTLVNEERNESIQLITLMSLSSLSFDRSRALFGFLVLRTLWFFCLQSHSTILL